MNYYLVGFFVAVALFYLVWTWAVLSTICDRMAAPNRSTGLFSMLLRTNP